MSYASANIEHELLIRGQHSVLSYFRAIRAARFAAWSRKLRFFFNGIKTPDGKLHKGYFKLERSQKDGSPFVTFHSDDYGRQHPSIELALDLVNNSDSQTDYFEKSTAKILSGSFYFKDACLAAAQDSVRFAKRMEKKGYSDESRRAYEKANECSMAMMGISATNA